VTYTDIIVEKKGAAAWLTLNKPHVLNAMGRKTLTEILAALKDTAKDPAIMVLIIRGAGNTFCTGMDVKEGIAPGGPGAEEFTKLADSVFKGLKKYEKITIAMVNGYCMAGGFELALCCDFIIAEENCKIGDGHINLPGFVPNAGASVYLPRLIGTRKAKEILLTGDLISGKEAEKIGLANRAVPADKLEQTVEEIIAKLASKSPLGLKSMKMLIDKGIESSVATALSLERATLKMMVNSEDYQEAVSAMAKKQKPDYKQK
jgi:enoyl-CoA hydratase/carnithine racemase